MHPEYAASFDPRARHWYQRALANGGLVSTTPYAFYSSGKTGTTLAIAARGGHKPGTQAQAGARAGQSGTHPPVRPDPGAGRDTEPAYLVDEDVLQPASARNQSLSDVTGALEKIPQGIALTLIQEAIRDGLAQTGQLEIAGGHHEKMDGTGYPKRLKGEEMSPLARMMAIADLFEALTAPDRPCKKAKTLSESIHIMSCMKRDQHIDPDLFELFLVSGVYRDYAAQFMNKEQIDHVDIGRYVQSAI
ncbi:HD domain-containing phosphohydrolase [Cupriavidus basilensis]|uniref:HD domain-containing phosphohydrolase n=1 Tax=Cupriavidus basilensis TaxID=68895 RepID=UPI0039F6D572